MVDYLFGLREQTLLVVFFAGFVAFTALAILLARRRWVRGSYLAVFFSLLLLVNLTPLVVLPMNDFHKFSEAAEREHVEYQLFVADEAGDELRFDRRVVPTMSPPTTWPDRLITQCSPSVRREIADYLLTEAREYRHEVARDGPLLGRLLSFPRHHLDFRWTEKTLAEYGNFTTVVVYRVTVLFERGSDEVADRVRTRVFEFAPRTDDDAPTLSEIRRCS